MLLLNLAQLQMPIKLQICYTITTNKLENSILISFLISFKKVEKRRGIHKSCNVLVYNN